MLFTHPNVASVGLTERRAVEKGMKVKSRTLEMRHVPKARGIRDTRGLIKIVAEEGTEKVLGVHILGPEAAEVIHQAVFSVRSGMTVREITEKIDVYPTLSEMVSCARRVFTRRSTGFPAARSNRRNKLPFLPCDIPKFILYGDIII